jgi:two-component system response regulator PilR (NtrC family)
MEHKILIVDDEKGLVHALRQTLQFEFPGLQIDAAYSGEEGLSRLAEAAYDLIIADLRMPGFGGLELVRGVRYLNPDVPIILVTGFGTDEARHEAAQLGVSYFLDKPFDVADLLSAMSEFVADEESDKR